MKSSRSVLFWVLVIGVLTLVFGRIDNDYLYAFYFVTLLLPVMVGTSYLFNQFLIPQYLQKQKYFKFSLFSLYAIITSMYLEMIVLVLAFIYLANYTYNQMNPLTTDVVSLTITLYFIVLIRSFVFLIKQSQDKQQTINRLETVEENIKKGHLLVRANRQTAKVIYEDINHLESLSDYVKIFTATGKPILTKEKISNIEKRLPPFFLRIHRSYIVNTNKVESFTKAFRASIHL